MIIAVSIVDKHKPEGQRHVGTYLFEIDYPGDSHFDFLTVACPVENEDTVRAEGLGLLTKDTMTKPMRAITRYGENTVLGLEPYKP
jgi:hypothetical protein